MVCMHMHSGSVGDRAEMFPHPSSKIWLGSLMKAPVPISVSEAIRSGEGTPQKKLLVFQAIIP